MATESSTYGPEQLQGFLDEMRRRDRDELVRRLRAGIARLQELSGRLGDDPTGGDGWSAKEVVAHMHGFVKLYGVFGGRIARGALTEVELVPVVRLRDAAIEAETAQPAAAIADAVVAEASRTAAMLEALDPATLARTCSTDVGTFSAGDVLRLTLVTHLEEHLEQLEAALAAG